MDVTAGDLERLDRHQLVAVAHDHMLTGMIVVKAITPMLMLHAGLSEDDMPQLSIEQWMGASPVYTHRMRNLMGIDGADVPAIMKALQLDVGFVHQYMDVAYQVDDPLHGEFWLAHCGALLDVEPFGERQVFDMCHTIEDPTFDATALATNPRARIRPLHRPPRVPADRHPHCHWTIVIDEANEPVGPIALTQIVERVALASIPNVLAGERTDGLLDYTGAFEPSFHLGLLSSATLAAVAREFQVQAHLLVASVELALADRPQLDDAEGCLEQAWLSAAWILAERLGRSLDLGTGTEAAANALRLTSALPPGLTRTVSVDGETISLSLAEASPGLLDASHPGWLGALARGVTTGLEGTVRGTGSELGSCRVEVGPGRVDVELEVLPGAPATPDPEPVSLSRIGLTADWTFEFES